MAQTYYNPQIAEIVGLGAAIVFERLRFFVEKKAENKNTPSYFLKQGQWWVYNSCKDWANIIPGLSQKQIGRALEKLFQLGFIRRNNYNRTKYDRTYWYTVNPEILIKYPEDINSEKKEAKSLKSDISHFREMEEPKTEMEVPNSGNPSTEIGKPIPEESTEESPYESHNKNAISYFSEKEENLDPRIFEHLDLYQKYWRRLKAIGNQRAVARFYRSYEAFEENFNFLYKRFWEKNPKASSDEDSNYSKVCAFIENTILKGISCAARA